MPLEPRFQLTVILFFEVMLCPAVLHSPDGPDAMEQEDRIADNVNHRLTSPLGSDKAHTPQIFISDAVTVRINNAFATK